MKARSGERTTSEMTTARFTTNGITTNDITTNATTKKQRRRPLLFQCLQPLVSSRASAHTGVAIRSPEARGNYKAFAGWDSGKAPVPFCSRGEIYHLRDRISADIINSELLSPALNARRPQRKIKKPLSGLFLTHCEFAHAMISLQAYLNL